jgi:hypothetical protein
VTHHFIPNSSKPRLDSEAIKCRHSIDHRPKSATVKFHPIWKSLRPGSPPESYNWSRTEYYSKSMPHANPQPMPPILSVHHGVRSPCNKTMERKYQISHAKSSNMLLRTVLENIQDINSKRHSKETKEKKTLV